MDRYHLLDLFVNNEKTLLKVYEGLFPHRANAASTGGLISGGASMMQQSQAHANSLMMMQSQANVGMHHQMSHGQLKSALINTSNLNYGPLPDTGRQSMPVVAGGGDYSRVTGGQYNKNFTQSAQHSLPVTQTTATQGAGGIYGNGGNTHGVALKGHF